MGRLIPLAGKYGTGLYAIVDDEDYEIASRNKWRLSSSGYVIRSHYPQDWQHGKVIFLHKLIAVHVPNKQVDHINRNKLDNRKCNLRLCTESENNQNKAKHWKGATSIYVGVKKDKHDKWIARTMKDKRYIHIGIFKTEVEAALAYNKKVLELFGSNAHINEIREYEKDYAE